MKRAARAMVSAKGQVTIPGALRKRLGIDAGTILEFREEPGRLIVTKASVVDPIDRVRGILHEAASVDEMIEEMRGPALLP